MRALLVLGLAACYAPHLNEGAPCSATEPCPIEQMCIAGACRVGPPATDASGPMIDTDRDGIADEVDNCPNVANVDQADEDSDGSGDACDPCPIVANASSVDTDGDHIPDACDPHPTVAGDTLVAFSGFPGGVLPAGWMPSGTIMPSNGDVELISNVAISAGAAVLAPDAAFTNGTITALVTLDTEISLNGDPDAGIFVSLLNPTSGDNIECGIYQTDITKPTTRVIDIYDSLTNNGNGSDLKTATFAWVPGTSYQVTLARQGTNYTCSAAPVGGSPTSITASTGSSPAGGLPSVLNFDGTGHVGYLMVVHSP